MKRATSLWAGAILFSLAGQGWAQQTELDDAWQPIGCSRVGGLLGERLAVWRDGRLWHMFDAEDDYLLSRFESRPGRHPWQGEHVGKWLHAATLAYEQTRDERLLKALQETVDRLLAPNCIRGRWHSFWGVANAPGLRPVGLVRHRAGRL